MQFIKKFSDITMHDLPQVGGKNASLGQMIQGLSKQQIPIPDGFAVTVDGYWHFLTNNALTDAIKQLLIQWHANPATLEQTSKAIRTCIEQAPIPADLQQAIINAYNELCHGNDCTVAVRSSATAEDLPSASFAGQQESFLNIHGEQAVLDAYKKCLSSLFTPRAILYRQQQNINDMRVGLSVGIQRMVRSDLACAGVAFTIDTETGFKDVVLINGSWGLGESVVQGSVTPDSFLVHKPTLKQGFKPLLKKECGSKTTKIIYAKNESTQEVPVEQTEQRRYCLTDEEILTLARMCIAIEDYYSTQHGTWTPMDIEWAKDGNDGIIYIVQARPETVFSHKPTLAHYTLTASDKEKVAHLIIQGQSIGKKIVSGPARVVMSSQQTSTVQPGEIIITHMTDPDWLPAMQRAAGIVTDIGGRTCHAAIVSRELGIPAIVGTGKATTAIKTGDIITLDCSQGEVGYIYQGALAYTTKEVSLDTQTAIPIDLRINIADPNQALTLSFLPVQGVGLARLEFIIANTIKIHPMALIESATITDAQLNNEIDLLTTGYSSKKDFFIDTLAQQAGTIAAAFYPRPVIIRLSDFKSNEYRNLLGGSYFEPLEENPMLGLRGASRYYSPLYEQAFILECQAMKKMRNEMGLTNIKIMIPFVRTTQEAEKVLTILNKEGLQSGDNGLEILMMCEIPSNVILMEQFCSLFDGFSIGSNDLTQMTLAVDRDSGQLSNLFDERNEAVIAMITLAIEGAQRNNKPIGICGQAPSDYPELAEFLIDIGIDYISLNPDSVLPFIARFTK